MVYDLISKLNLKIFSIMSKQTVLQKVKEHFTLFLVKQINPPPILIFVIYIYLHLQIQTPHYLSYSFFTAGLIYALLFSYNHFYLYSPILTGGIGYLSILNLFIGLLAANQKWKLYLYLFIIGDSITIQYASISKIYIIVCTMYLSTDIYRNLIFKAINDNIMFFTGFFTISIFQLFFKILISIDGYAGIAYFTVPFAILIGYKIITNRVKQLKKKSIHKIRNVEQAYHYISLIKDQIKSPYTRQGFIQDHKLNCTNIECFCHYNQLLQGQKVEKINFSTKVEYYFIRSLFEQVLKIKSIPKKEFLYNKLIEFLIENNQITQAIELYTKLQCLSAKFYYFRWVQRTRLYYKIQQKLNQYEYFNIFTKEFVYVFKYDNSYLYLASQIKQILKKKVQFWLQVGKETPLMIKLQQSGSEIVQKMYELNNYYYKQIKQQQQKINNFNGTIIYAMYLLSTTNYKEYAQSLIKNTSRTLQSIKIHQDNIAQTFGLKILIRDAKRSCNQKIQNLDSIVSSAQIQELLHGSQPYSSFNIDKQNIDRAKRFKTFYQDGFVQIIVNVSGSLCKLLKTSKNNLIGQDLNTIIPVSYQQKHHNKLQKLLHYNDKTCKKLVSLSFINKFRQVPLKTKDNKLIATKISVKIYQGIEEGISFIALVQTINQNKVTLITNLDGKVQQYQEGLSNLKILQCEQISITLNQLKQQWKSEKKINSKKINLAFNDNNYSILFSSPYQFSFIQCQDTELYQQNGESEDESKKLYHQQNVYGQSGPPIHIDITNESIPYLINGKQDRQQQMTKCIKKMESVFYKTDIDSQASTSSSRKSSVVNVLMSFSENYFIPFYGYIMGVFVLVLIGSIVANSIGFSQLNLDWDNTIQNKNPIINIISTMHIKALITRTVNHQMDLSQYKENHFLNKSTINNFYGLDKSDYSTYVKQEMRRIQLKYKKAVTSTSMYVADILSKKLQSSWQILVNTTNPNNPNPQKRTQQLPLQNIFMNYLVDLDLLALGKSYAKTIISLNFWPAVQNILSKVSNLKDLVQSSIITSKTLNIVYCSIAAIIIFLTAIPLYILFKKRVKRHIDIYDLIVSVQGQLIRQQIKKLNNIITIVNNSNESSQVLKTNTINYLARKRSSALNENLVGSNEMIEGLIETNNDLIVETQDELLVSQGLQTKNGFLIKKAQQIQIEKKDAEDKQIVAQQTKKLVLRKRSGQLDLKDSEADFKRIVCKHFFLYFLIVLSTFALFSITISKIKYFDEVNNTFTKLIDIYNNYTQESLLLLNAKMFFRGMPKVDFPYKETNFINWLQTRIYLNFALQFNSDFPQQFIYSSCPEVTDQINQFQYCQKNYSLLTLRQQVNHYLKQSYQKRLNLNTQFNITNNNMTSLPQSQLKDMSEYFFYVQSMEDRIANITQDYIDQKIQNMFNNQNNLKEQMKVIYIVGLCWGIICLIVGLFIINHMKKLYFKEIIIVSFLNNQMISKNKRVQSFLQTLSKSSY